MSRLLYTVLPDVGFGKWEGGERKMESIGRLIGYGCLAAYTQLEELAGGRSSLILIIVTIGSKSESVYVQECRDVVEERK